MQSRGRKNSSIWEEENTPTSFEEDWEVEGDSSSSQWTEDGSKASEEESQSENHEKSQREEEFSDNEVIWERYRDSQYKEDNGITEDLNELEIPIDFFNLFLTDEFLRGVCENTDNYNKVKEEKNKKKKKLP